MKTAPSKDVNASELDAFGPSKLSAGPLGETAPRGSPTDGPFHETRLGWLVLAVVWLSSCLYLGLHIKEGWIPPDAGMLSEMAARVLRGQLPYRDFMEVYTGGLTFLDALSFRIFGADFFSLRIPLFLFFCGWVPSVYLIARRFTGPLVAGAITLLAVAWSVPNYPEAMPSWYNLFFATWGVLALFRYMENGHRRWLWVAGLCGGLSFLVKIVALYFVAAVLLFIVFREDSISRRDRKRGGAPYRVFATIGLLLFLATLLTVLSERPTLGDAVNFALPSGCLVALLLWRTWRLPSGPSVVRLRRLTSVGMPFLGGALLPVLGFLLWYAKQGALAAWFRGTFIGGSAQVLWGAGSPRPLAVLAGLLPAIAAGLLACRRAPYSRRWAPLAVPCALAALLIVCWRVTIVRLFVGGSLPLVVPVLALWALVCLARPKLPEGTEQRVFLLVAVAVAFSLIQFPACGALYFCYAAPLVALALLALFSAWGVTRGAAVGALLAFYLLFGVWLHTPSYLGVMHPPTKNGLTFQQLGLARAGGLMVQEAQAREYERLVAFVRSHATGAYIYCAPDCPQVYFLSEERNPTGTIWDFLDPDFADVPERSQRILAAVEEHSVSVVVYNNGPFVESGPVAKGLRAALDRRFPEAQKVGSFEVRWKPRPAAKHTPRAGGGAADALRARARGRSPARSRTR